MQEREKHIRLGDHFTRDGILVCSCIFSRHRSNAIGCADIFSMQEERSSSSPGWEQSQSLHMPFLDDRVTFFESFFSSYRFWKLTAISGVEFKRTRAEIVYAVALIGPA